MATKSTDEDDKYIGISQKYLPYLCDFVTELTLLLCYNRLTKHKTKGDINMSAIRLNNDNFDQVRNNEGIALLDFYADWCGPCRMVLPLVDEIAAERDDLLVGKINVNDNPELAREFGVISIPTLIVMKDGKIINRASGARSKEKILELVGA